MDAEIIIVDQAYKYEVEEILEGGIGYVRLMSMLEYSRKPPDTGGLAYFECAGEGSKYPYRNQLAAKTTKDVDGMEVFAKACEPWLELNMQGVVPLLKLIKNGEEILALMPRYSGNLRALMQSDLHSPEELLRALSCAVSCLSKVHEDSGIVHQAIKPENFLYFYHRQKLVFELSDFGIADVQAGYLPTTKAERLKAVESYGMLPYMAPERFDTYLADIRADIFSLGMICFEIINGGLPYSSERNVQEQILSGEFYRIVQSKLPENMLSNLVLRMIEPLREDRMKDFHEFLELIGAL